MPEFKLWYNKTENKNGKVAKMMGFIKTCGKFSFGHFISFIILPTFCCKKQIFKQACLGEIVYFFLMKW